MKRGGLVIYAGLLGWHSSKLIEYFEVSSATALLGFIWLKLFSSLQISCSSRFPVLHVF